MSQIILRGRKAGKVTQMADIKTEWKRFYSEDGTLLYEGEVYKDKPCGKGTSYFHNGNKYQEGEFGIKGLLSGKEYYPNGILRFEGQFKIHRYYGPNPPIEGTAYDIEGNPIYRGKFKHRYGNIPHPVVVVPKRYGSIKQLEAPKELNYLWYDDLEED